MNVTTPTFERWLIARLARFASICLCVFAMGGMRNVARAEVVASDSFEYPIGALQGNAGGVGWAAGWKTPPKSTQYLCDELLTYSARPDQTIGAGRSVAIHGIGNRNNPLRRELSEPFTGAELYARFLIRYDADSLDNAGPHGDGEFFVLWLDDLDGGDGAGHNPNIPNIGINVGPDATGASAGKNVFMARIGSENTAFSNVEVRGNQTYLIVLKLSKTQPDALGAYDRLALWVNPDLSGPQPPPVAEVRGRASNFIRWVGFATGKKTEPTDYLLIDELAVSERWNDIVPAPAADEHIAAHSDGDVHKPSEARLAKVDFRHDVYPILQKHCFACHVGADAESGHRLDVKEEILGHVQGKPLVVLGNSGASPLIQVLVTSDESARMPQGEDPLAADEIAILRAWVDQGLAWDDELLPSVPLQSQHWSFQPVKRPELPRRDSSGRAANPVDAFIAAKQVEIGVRPVPLVDRRTFIRRATLVVTGLPPTPEEIAVFLADQSPDAYRRLVDRLLNSPQYGEHWGRYWLDLARWAESDGYQHNEERPTAWRYRDYVVRSFTLGKPYDRFVREQLAGDEMEPCTDENLIATGFLAAARYSDNELDKVIQRNDILVDITNTTASSLLGITMQCAQCHTHKFDPITARDYYRFQGFFTKGQPVNVLLRGKSAPEDYEKVIEAIDEQYRLLAVVRTKMETQQRMAGLPVFAITREMLKAMTDDQRKRYKELVAQISGFESTWSYYSPVTSSTAVGVPFHAVTSPLPYVPSQLERARPVLLVRGDVQSPGPEVDVGWPAVFGPPPADGKLNRNPRSALADWLFDPENPLTARVWVNRIWQHHFGTGLVATPDDFGTQGAKPTHPELLDWLAFELIESGWNTAHIQRLILLSDTFQRSAQNSDAAAAIDPDNQYLWRWTMRRLSAESIRDSMLATSGLLDTAVGGPSVPAKESEASTRRTLYLEQIRGELPFVQQVFDAPSAIVCTGRRRTSTAAVQPLFLLNSPMVYGYAEALANRAVEETATAKDAGDVESNRVSRAFELALGRPPRERELQVLLGYLRSAERDAPPAAGDDTGGNSDRPFVKLCHGLLNLNEFLYIP
jgi:hypothetical protein